MFTDERRDKVWNEIRQHDLRSFTGLLTAEVFTDAIRIANLKIGQNALNLVNLVWLGISSAIHYGSSFAFVLMTTLKVLEDHEGFDRTHLGKMKKAAQDKANRKSAKKKGKKGKKSKHHPHPKDPTQVSEEAFVQARQKMPLEFWMALLLVLAERFQRNHSKHLMFGGFRLLTIDGTVIPLENVEALRKYYGRPKNKSRKKADPQARMVMLTFPGVRIPLAYEVSPLCESELTLAGRLMPHLRSNDLLLMDRGFISYGLFWQIQNKGAFFGTRLKKGLNFKTTKRLGYKDRLVEWTPCDSRGKWKDLPSSITLRVIEYQIRGFRPAAIVTNALDPKSLPREDWVRLASDCEQDGVLRPGLYHRRWEIETTYFELKIGLHLKNLRSRTPASVEYEIAGRVIYYMLVRWLIVLAAEKHGLDPLRISFTNTLRELDSLNHALITSSMTWIVDTLLPRLLDRIASHTVPLRPGRHYPRPNDTKSKNKGNGRYQAASKMSTRVNSNPKKKERQTHCKA
jgi:hypothetical protein